MKTDSKSVAKRLAAQRGDSPSGVAGKAALNITPLTPLPWALSADSAYTVVDETGGQVAECETIVDAIYVFNAANAYPELIAALRQYRAKSNLVYLGELDKATDSLLRKLGEYA